MNWGKLFVLGCLLIVSHLCWGQDYLATVRQYGVADGLSHREVYGIHEDQRGFIWFGTKYGLNRFDGYQFKWYSREKNGLSSNVIHHIMEDAAHRLWLFESDNWYHKTPHTQISIFDVEQEKAISPASIPGLEDLLEARTLTGYLASPQHTLYFSKNSQLIRYRPEEGLKSYAFSEWEDFQIKYYTSDDHIWGIRDKKILLELDTLGNVISQFTLEKLASEDFRVKILGKDTEGKLSFTLYHNRNFKEGNSRHEVYQLDKTGTFTLLNEQLAQEHRFPTDWGSEYFYQAQRDLYWYKVLPKFFVFQKKGGMIYDFTHSYPELANSQIHEIYFDNSDRIWLSNTQGLFQIDFNRNPFQRILFQDPLTQKADKVSCRALWVDGKKLHINSYQGVFIHDLDHQTTSKRPYQDDINIGEPDLIFYDPLAIFKDSKGNFWYGEERLIKIDTAANIQVYRTIGDHNPEIWSIWEGPTGRIWLGTNSGLMYFDPTGSSSAIQSFQQKLAGHRIWAFVDAPTGDSCYLATSTGLYLFEPQAKTLKALSLPTDKMKLLRTDIRHLHIDREEGLWLASYGSGLIHWNRKTDSLRQYTLADGLANNNLYAVYEDQADNLWLSSDYGIIMFNKNTRRSKGFLLNNGITDIEFNSISHFQAEDGQLFFGGLNGVTAFYPSLLPNTQLRNPPKLQISAFKKYDSRADSVLNFTRSITQNPKIVLAPGERFFEIDFALLSFEEPHLIRYNYLIEGLDKTWRQISTRSLQISGLPYGSFTLRVKGQLANGQFSPYELAIPIEVLRPFYAQWWFILISLVLLAGLVFSWYKARTTNLVKRKNRLEKQVKQRTLQIQEAQKLQEAQNKQLAKQAEELKELDSLKSRFFANVSHELRTPLSLMLGPINTALKNPQITNKNFTLLSLAKNNGQKLLQMVNEILDLTKFEKDKLTLQNAPTLFYQLVKQILANFEYEAQQKNIQFLFTYELSHHAQVMVDSKKFEVILRNLLSNAFKFTPQNGKVAVQVSSGKNGILVQVEDTGRGIHAEDLEHIFDRFFQSKRPDGPTEGGTGIGLSLCKAYAELMGGELWVSSEWGKGSVFQFQFPGTEVIVSMAAAPPKQDISVLPLSSFTDQDDPLHLNEEEGDKAHLLVVEDNRDVQTYLKTLLDGHWRLSMAENGQAAMDILDSLPQGQQIDLIISDLMMPIMDGFQLVETIRNHPDYLHIPLIMLTARADQQSKLKALRIGVDDFLAKPFDEEELLARIEHLLAFAAKRNEIHEEESSTESEDTSDSKLSQADLAWLAEMEQLVRTHLDSFELNAQSLADKLSISRVQLYRKLKKCTGLSPSEYLQEVRYRTARELMETQQVDSVKAAAYQVGIRHLGKFAGEFKKRFGKSPSQFLF